MEASLVLEARNRGLGQHPIEFEGLLNHTDQSGQYLATTDRELLQTQGVTCSMSTNHRCHDNGAIESLPFTCKHELRLIDDAESKLAPQQIQSDLIF
jgi:transposase InsO family protein